MRAPRSVLLLSLALIFTACSKQHNASERGPAGAHPATALSAPPAHTGAGTPAGKATAPTLARPNADGSETVENATGDSGAHNLLLAAVASTVAAATSTANAENLAGPTLWQPGVNYTQLVPAQPTSVAAGQVEVLEFFWYACPHCYHIEPLVESWKKTKPSYVSFSPVPVTWSDGHRALARLFFTLDTLGKLDQLHNEVFKEIQVNGNPLVARDPSNEAETERIQTAFAVKMGISEDAFKKAYHSFSVDNGLLKADQAVLRYRVEGVPTFVVNGKYVADVASAGSPERLISLVSDLAAQEHKH
jgi:protein dithiol oxidoreductase (disulfide-forming)